MEVIEIKHSSYDDLSQKSTPRFQTYVVAVNTFKNRGHMVGVEYPKRHMFYGGVKYNQFSRPEFERADCHFAFANAISAMNMQIPDAMIVSWIRMKKNFGALDEKGSTFSQNINWAKEMGYLDSSYLTKTIGEMKTALSMGHTLVGSSHRFNWDRQAKNGFMFVPQKQNDGDHAVAFVGYDDELIINGKKGFFVCLDSRGSEAWNNGYFYVQYEDARRYFGRIIALVKWDFEGESRELLQGVIEVLHQADLIKVWDGYKQKAKVSYFETALMILKALALGKKINDEAAIQMAISLEIIPTGSRESDGDMYRRDVVAMIMRAMYRDSDGKIKNDLLEIAVDVDLWDGAGKDSYATRDWTVLMIMKALRFRKKGLI